MNRGDKNRWRKKKKRKELGKVEPVIGLLSYQGVIRDPRTRIKSERTLGIFPEYLRFPNFSPLFCTEGGDAVDTRTSRDQCVIRTRASESRKMKIKIRNECKK